MSSLVGVFKAFVAPAVIALGLYLALHFVLVPMYQRHRARYSQYLPVHTQNPLSTLSSSTSGLRSRIFSTFLLFLMPSRWAEWRYARGRSERIVNDDDDDDDDDDEEMGEDLDFDVGRERAANDDRQQRRRDGLSLSIDARARDTSDRRLSRELEEGFADSSDDESDPQQHDSHGRDSRR